MRLAPSIKSILTVAAMIGWLAPATTSQAADDNLINHIEVFRSELNTGKTEVYTRYLQFTEAESKVFWPIYREYEVELSALGDRRVELTRQFVEAHNAATLDEDLAKDVSKKHFKLEQDRLKLLKKYHGKISKQLSTIRAVQFVQIERQIKLVLDLVISADMPLAGTAPAL